MNDILLTLKNITKTYPGVVALDDVSVSFCAGEVHALLGENGAGKSTMIKIISGAVEPDRGNIEFPNRSYTKMQPHQAKEEGVEVIYQEFNLVPSLSVAENISLGDTTGKFPDFKLMDKRASDLFEDFNISIDPKELVRNLSVSHQQIVEIAKAVSKKCKLLIMDEPSAPLSVSEVENMFKIVRKFRSEGIGIIYISHRMDEIFSIADKVTVMRDGQYVKTLNVAETSRKELIGLMVGRELKETYPTHKPHDNEVALELQNVTGNGVSDINIKLHKGEILGIAGLVGAGRTELAKLIYGDAKLISGKIMLNGKSIINKSPYHAIANGIGLIPENRKEEGCFMEVSIDRNISISILERISKLFVVNKKKEKVTAENYQQLLSIRTPSLAQKVKNLSGGNQQKVVLAKTLATNSNIIIFDEPTRGIDVGAKQEIYNLMCELANQGKAIMMITSDMEELLGMSDGIVVMCEGKISGFIEKEEFTQELVLEFASTSHNKFWEV